MVNETSAASPAVTGGPARPNGTTQQAAATQRLASAGGRRIVICCDGTSNHPNSPTPTNIVKIARGITPKAPGDIDQIVFYDRGVGSGGTLDGIFGGAFGWGLQGNVEDAYRFIVHNYRPGDHVFLFGFSRGAYTARSVAGLMRQCSILKSENAHLIKEGYDNYRDPNVDTDDTASEEWRKNNSHPMPIIEFLGVFDTVGAMGVPANRFIGAAKFWGWGFWKGLKPGGNPAKTDGPRPSRDGKKWSKGKSRHGFHDMRLSRWVRSAFHALAIDEKRPVFSPAIWDSELKRLPKNLPGKDWNGKLTGNEVGLSDEHQSVVQTWFPGAHSDVGGNEKVHNSSLALKWMATAAYQASGLEFDDLLWNEINDDIKVCGKLSGSPPGVWKGAGWEKRDMSGNAGGTECIHESAFARLDDSTTGYKIGNRGYKNLPECEGGTEVLALAKELAEGAEAELAAVQ